MKKEHDGFPTSVIWNIYPLIYNKIPPLISRILFDKIFFRIKGAKLEFDFHDYREISTFRYVFQGIVRSERGVNHKGYFHACNLITDEHGHGWIIDGQIQRVFDLNQPDHIKELNEKYRPDYVARASTGAFQPTQLDS